MPMNGGRKCTEIEVVLGMVTRIVITHPGIVINKKIYIFKEHSIVLPISVGTCES